MTYIILLAVSAKNFTEFIIKFIFTYFFKLNTDPTFRKTTFQFIFIEKELDFGWLVGWI